MIIRFNVFFNFVSIDFFCDAFRFIIVFMMLMTLSNNRNRFFTSIEMFLSFLWLQFELWLISVFFVEFEYDVLNLSKLFSIMDSCSCVLIVSLTFVVVKIFVCFVLFKTFWKFCNLSILKNFSFSKQIVEISMLS